MRLNPMPQDLSPKKRMYSVTVYWWGAAITDYLAISAAIYTRQDIRLSVRKFYALATTLNQSVKRTFAVVVEQGVSVKGLKNKYVD